MNVLFFVEGIAKILQMQNYQQACKRRRNRACDAAGLQLR
jgi:hypothetical protein